MRTLKLQMQISADGFIASPEGKLDWITWNWDQGIKDHVSALTEPVDCILLGRNVAEGFIPHWTALAQNPETAGEELAFARKMADTPKVVFSRTLDQSKWDNTQIAGGALDDEIARLKQQDGGDIIVYGGGELVSSLIGQGLIDELNLFVNPTAIGEGMSIFRDRTGLKLRQSKAFDCGIVLLQYEPLR
ncbi:MAG: dihydrofolate reductase [Saprospiraceae bacterium]|nr:dihydrofolate reductase [Saprospiraceae bacterium]MCB0576205.1 dihydrofolate reductase [Saprospiraceae bacterium]MCB9354321.1 dihydrofolate reductase [Lewinellaceae bacterium]